jgi:uncharacterized phage-associated protein
MSLGIIANKAKIGILLTYICTEISGINLRKLLKILFLIDELSTKNNGFPITWLDYYAWIKGPVAPEIYNLKHGPGVFSNYVFVKKQYDGVHVINPVSNIDVENGLLEFSINELKTINAVLNKYKRFGEDDLSRITRKPDSLWDKAVKQNNIDFNSAKKTDIRVDLKDLVIDDDEKYSIYLEAEENIIFKGALLY